MMKYVKYVKKTIAFYKKIKGEMYVLTMRVKVKKKANLLLLLVEGQ